MIYYPEKELKHHGIKGQKWGLRRYQYEDGTLTPEGRRRYGYSDEKKAKAKENYEKAAANYKAVRKANTRFGVVNTVNGKEKMTKARLKELHALADYNAAKEKKAEKALKAEQKTYVNWLKEIGLPGSMADLQSGGVGTALYKDIAKVRGKDYAEAIYTKAANKNINSAAVASAAAVGLEVLNGILYMQS